VEKAFGLEDELKEGRFAGLEEGSGEN